MKFLKSLTITAKNTEKDNTSRYALLDLEACLKNMEINKSLVTNFLKVIEPIYKYINNPSILKTK